MSKIAYNIGGRELEFKIIKFKANQSLDFIIDLINLLPQTLKMSPESNIDRDTIRYIIFMVMDVGDDVKLDDTQKELIKDLANADLIKLIFKEAYMNASADKRNDIREQLFSLLRMDNNEELPDEVERFIKTPKELFSAMVKIVKYNYEDFFLITEN